MEIKFVVDEFYTERTSPLSNFRRLLQFQYEQDVLILVLMSAFLVICGIIGCCIVVCKFSNGLLMAPATVNCSFVYSL